MTSPRLPRRALLAIVVACLSSTAVSLPASARPDPGPSIDRPEESARTGRLLDVTDAVSGRAALDAAGDRLGEVAALNAMSTDLLRRILLSDPTTFVTSSGHLLFRDRSEASPADASVRRAAAAAPFPSAATFRLHSLPGSKRTIFLDFDGVTVRNTVWNNDDGLADRAVKPFDTDGKPKSFGADERAVIQSVWQRVAEDYAPFDVDVTTQAPAAGRIDRAKKSDQVFGTVAAISADADAHRKLCRIESCLGVAQGRSFAESGNHRYYQPGAWAFNQNGCTFADCIADVVTHEVGHTFGLYHWGDRSSSYSGGQGPWYPIMGAGNRPIGQWSRGEYPGAVGEYPYRQDDVAFIASNGAPKRADDAGGTVAAADPALPTATLPGVIGDRADVDAYALGTCTGEVSVTGATAYENPNLDLKLTLLDQDGSVLACADPPVEMVDPYTATGLDATVTTTVAEPGAPLFVAVDGVGYRTWRTDGYGDYGSLGSYLLTVAGCGDGGPPPEPAG